MAERYGNSGYGLQNIASDLRIEYQPHDALEDARAAAEVVLHACTATGFEIEEWLERVERPILPTAGTKKSARQEGNPGGPLYGEVVVFTGTLGIPRRTAEERAAAEGCQVADRVTKKTTMLIVGIQDRAALRGDKKSGKHKRAEELIRQGVQIRILSEQDFGNLLTPSG